MFMNEQNKHLECAIYIFCRFFISFQLYMRFYLKKKKFRHVFVWFFFQMEQKIDKGVCIVEKK